MPVEAIYSREVSLIQPFNEYNDSINNKVVSRSTNKINSLSFSRDSWKKSPISNESIREVNPKQLIEKYRQRSINIVKEHKYYELGGLGPFNIGTEQWKKGK